MNRFYSSVTINFILCLDFRLLEMLGGKVLINANRFCFLMRNLTKNGFLLNLYVDQLAIFYCWSLSLVENYSFCSLN